VSFSAIAGQLAYLDVFVAALIVLGCEVVSSFFHRNRFNFRRTILGESLYAYKLGITYSLFLIAFMLGS
jgi:peptidoglycan biosynthesis protein MviN/MurJ (putative lipid II flippase)